MLPNQIPIEIEFQPGPLAAPVTVALPVGGGLKVLATGGLTREEAVAAPLFAQILGQRLQSYNNLGDEASQWKAATAALKAAEVLLAVSAGMRAAKEAPDENDSNRPHPGPLPEGEGTAPTTTSPIIIP